MEKVLDYVCPYSRKMFITIYSSVASILSSTPYASRVSLLFRPQIQPWHPSSTLCHEAATAVLILSPEKFWPFSAALFESQLDFFDVNVVNETRNQTYRRLAKVAARAGVDEEKIYALLEVSDKPGEGGALNVGNKVTNDVKRMVRQNRVVGVHVTPTVMFNVRPSKRLQLELLTNISLQGLVEPSIESSFTPDQWEDWIKKNIV
jgi:protein-disulfide isomerase